MKLSTETLIANLILHQMLQATELHNSLQTLIKSMDPSALPNDQKKLRRLSQDASDSAKNQYNAALKLVFDQDFKE